MKDPVSMQASVIITCLIIVLYYCTTAILFINMQVQKDKKRQKDKKGDFSINQFEVGTLNTLYGRKSGGIITTYCILT